MVTINKINNFTVPGIIPYRVSREQEKSQEAEQNLVDPLIEKQKNFISKVPTELMLEIFKYLSTTGQLLQAMLVDFNFFDCATELLLTDRETQERWNWKGVKAIIKSPDSIEKIISNITISQEKIKNIFAEVNGNPHRFDGNSNNNLKILQLKKNIALLDSIKNNKEIKTLSLHINYILSNDTDEIIDNLIKIFESRSNLKNIELHLKCNQFTLDQMSNLVGSLHKNISVFSLESTVLNSNILQKLAPALENISILKLYPCGSSNIEKSDLDFLKGMLPNVVKLQLSGFNIEDGLEGVISQSTRILNLYNCKLSDTGIKNVVDSLTENIFELNLSYNKIGDEGLNYLSINFKKNIIYLNLSKNNFRTKGVTSILTIMKKNGVKRLHLKSNLIAFNDVQRLLRNLPKTSIEYINLEDIGSFTENQINELNLEFNKIIKNKHKKQINILFDFKFFHHFN